MVNTQKIISRCLGHKNNEEKKEFTDKAGYYTGYCQCNCKKCREGIRHCQGLVCKGD